MNDFILNDEQYNELKKGYEQELTPRPQQNLSDLSIIIHSLQSNNFQLPIVIQNKILNSLQQAQQILSIACTSANDMQTSDVLANNPFTLIKSLCLISQNLTSTSLKSPYQIIYLKANKLIMDCVVEILNYFENKNIKIYKFI